MGMSGFAAIAVSMMGMHGRSSRKRATIGVMSPALMSFASLRPKKTWLSFT